MTGTKRVIAIDIDEVTADFISYFIYFHNLMYKTKMTKNEVLNYSLYKAFETDKDEMSIRFAEFSALHLLERIAPVEGAVEGIKALIKKGYQPKLVTARPKVIEKETKNWLKIHFRGIDLPLYFSRDKNDHSIKKSIICADIGAKILIDDHLDNAYDCASEGITVFLMDAPWNKTEDLPANVIRVKSWLEILKKIK